MAGCMTALLTMFTLSALGLGALLQAFPSVFGALRWAGAAYLVYLGIKTWRASVTGTPPQRVNTMAESKGLYRGGILVAASNPKAILFAVSFFPQFIQADAPKALQFAILVGTFAVIEVGWYLVYATSGRGLAAYLQRDAVRTVFNRLTGGVFVGFAGLMATMRS
jgi:threonine/homoserine/homoserine lactone efflux protein